jgi:hypothetical protein
VVRSYLRNQHREALSDALLDEMVDERLTSERITCRFRTLSDVMREHGVERIDLLKIDAEKSESDVLAGIRDEDWPKIRQIVVEVHDVDGRLDQITSLLDRRGYRVTVGSEAMLEDTGLFDVYAVREPGSAEASEACAPAWSGSEALIGDVRTLARTKLPEYMVPSAFVLLDALPLTPNGKVDRRALPAPDARREERTYEPPRTAIEQALAGIWAQVLSVERVGLHDDFFELGGHSLLATSVMARVRSQLGLDVGLRVLFEASVFEAFADRIAAFGAALDGAEPRSDADYDEGVI